MPKSRLRTNRRIIATGSNMGQRRLSKSDMDMKIAAYNDKVEKYREMKLEDLKERWKEGNLGGIYLKALEDVITEKKSIELKEEV